MTTITLGELFRFETSERSRKVNWVQEGLRDSGFTILEYEGFTIKNQCVSLLMDRACFYGQQREWNLADLHKALKRRIPNYDLKCLFAKRLGVPWYFIAYMYDSERTRPIYVLKLLPSEVQIVKRMNSADEFANWLDEFRSLRMMSPYEEKGLPKFDRELRNLGKPWPGNLDGILSFGETLLFVVEFQTTNKVPVREHCNNKWFLPQGNRKGDEQRWFVLDIIRQQAQLPLLILVWSPREKVIKAKIVKEIVYSWNRNSRKKPGLYYSYKEILSLDELVRWLLAYCQGTA